MGTLVLAGRYEILEKIGDGGMAVVYKARDKQLNRFVAIKILKKEFIADQTFVENFIREAKAAASLLHPNIVTIHDAGRDRDIYYIVMEYVEGKALSSIIAAEAPLNYKTCIRISKQVASALALAHRNNIIHRDVKPHNILITSDGTAKITDFGIAKAVSDGTIINDSGMVMGSVHYFSPEQSRGQYVDEKSDIYSLGIVLYEMITGRVPFDADNPVTIAVMHMNDTIIPPSRLVKGVPPGLDQIVMKATAKYQSDRFNNIEEMYEALNNVDFITGMINGPAAAFVAPTSFAGEASEKGYSTMAEPEEDFPYRREEDDYDDYDKDYDRDYDRGGKGSRDRLYDDDYDDDLDRRKGLYGASGAGAKAAAGSRGREDEDDDDEKGPKLTQKQKLILIIAAIAIAIVVSIPIAGFLTGNIGYEPVEVPDVVGLYEREATDILTDAGFDVEIDFRALPTPAISAAPAAGDEFTDFDNLTSFNNTGSASDDEVKFQVGQVMEQSPVGGEMVKPGTKVTIIIADPPVDLPEEDIELGEPTEVPDIVGMSKSNAVAAIKAAGFKEGTVQYENSDQPVDTVISQSPKAGDIKPANSKIHFVISLGPKDTSLNVPRLIGLTEANALSTLSGLRLQGNVEKWFNSSITKDQVFEQNPAEGAKVKEGDTVTIRVSLGAVPNVVGMTEAQARSALEAVGLRYAKNATTTPTTDSAQDGRAQSQSATTGIRPGDTVTVTFFRYTPPAVEFNVTFNFRNADGSMNSVVVVTTGGGASVAAPAIPPSFSTDGGVTNAPFLAWDRALTGFTAHTTVNATYGPPV